MIAEGSGRIKLDDEVRDVAQWDILRIGPGVMRNLEAGSDGLTLIAFGAPLGEGNDGEIVPGWWSDGVAARAPAPRRTSPTPRAAPRRSRRRCSARAAPRASAAAGSRRRARPRAPPRSPQPRPPRSAPRARAPSARAGAARLPGRCWSSSIALARLLLERVHADDDALAGLDLLLELERRSLDLLLHEAGLDRRDGAARLVHPLDQLPARAPRARRSATRRSRSRRAGRRCRSRPPPRRGSAACGARCARRARSAARAPRRSRSCAGSARRRRPPTAPGSRRGRRCSPAAAP